MNAFLRAVQERIERERMDLLNVKARPVVPLKDTSEAAAKRRHKRAQYQRQRHADTTTAPGAGPAFKASLLAGNLYQARIWWRRCSLRYRDDLREWAVGEKLGKALDRVRGKGRVPRGRVQF